MLCRYCKYHQLILRRLSELERTDRQTDTHDYCMPRGSAHRGIIILKSLLCTDISISGEHTDLTVGTTYNITCTVPGLDDSSAIMWTSSAAAVLVSTTNTLTLQSVNNTLNGTEFTCSVNSSELYSVGENKISITTKGIILLLL